MFQSPHSVGTVPMSVPFPWFPAPTFGFSFSSSEKSTSTAEEIGDLHLCQNNPREGAFLSVFMRLQGSCESTAVCLMGLAGVGGCADPPDLLA